MAKADVRTRASAEDDAEHQVDRSLRQLAAYVESVAGADETIIISAGLETKTFRTSPTVLLALESLSATASDHEGAIDLT